MLPTSKPLRKAANGNDRRKNTMTRIVLKYLRLYTAIAIAIVVAACSGDGAGDSENGFKQGDPNGIYPITITAGFDEQGKTRAVWHNGFGGDGLYYWQPNDHVGLMVAQHDGVLIAPNVEMSNNRSAEGDVINTSFSGNFSSYINLMQVDGKYDYFSYFPYYEDAEVGVSFPNVKFEIPSTIELTPNVFTSEYAPMIGKVLDEKPIIYRHPGQGADTGKTINHKVHIKYEHVMAYMALEMDVRLLPANERVTRITINSNDDDYLSGMLNVDLSTGNASWISGSNTLVIDIAGGLAIGEGEVLYIPMLPHSISASTTFVFTFENTNQTKYHYRDLTGIEGTDLSTSNGVIRHLEIAPAAEYFSGATLFETTWGGNYYMEAWGGNGGNGANSAGSTGGDGGMSTKREAEFTLSENEDMAIYVGSAGENTTATGNTGGALAAGGTNGSNPEFGSGGDGGFGGPHNQRPGGRGGAGGAGTFILQNSLSPSLTTALLISGGGGGGGGATPHRDETNIDSGIGGQSDENGGAGSLAPNSGGSRGTNTGGGNGGVGAGFQANVDGANGSLGTGGKGGNATTDVKNNGSGGGGGGGGGGGYYSGGGGGGGECPNPGNGNQVGAGGGGGGAGYTNPVGSTTNPRSINNTRPNTNGYVVITPVRQLT